MTKLSESKTYWAKFKDARKKHIPTTCDVMFRAKMNALASHYANELVDVARDEFPDLIGNHFLLNCVFEWNEKRKCSRGGLYRTGPGISINMIRASMPFPVIEYSRFNKDREIGFVDTWSSEVHLAVTIAHEIAHAVQYYMRDRVLRKRLTPPFSKIPHDQDQEYKKFVTNNKPHGQLFQEIYRVLRVKYVNPKFNSMTY